MVMVIVYVDVDDSSVRKEGCLRASPTNWESFKR
jgi:hypothetical protein